MTVRPYFFRDGISEEGQRIITKALDSMISKTQPFKPGFLIFQKALIRACEKHWLAADTARPPTAEELYEVITDSPYFEFLNGGGDLSARKDAMHQAQAEEFGDSGLGLADIILRMSVTQKSELAPRAERGEG